jgi:hypothetical protein
VEQQSSNYQTAHFASAQSSPPFLARGKSGLRIARLRRRLSSLLRGTLLWPSSKSNFDISPRICEPILFLPSSQPDLFHLDKYQENSPQPQYHLLRHSTLVMDRRRIFAPREIESLIADGHIIIITEGRVLKLDGWLNKHPGGRLAVLHMVGRDATDEINV